MLESLSKVLRPHERIQAVAFVDQAVARIGRSADAAIPLLQAIQERFNYLPPDALHRVCEKTRITPAALAGVATFYARFRHKPAGKHIVRVCHGTACHVKGSQLVDDAIRRHLKLPPGADTDEQGLFTVDRVGCLGCCTLAPVIQAGPVTYGHRSSDNAYDALRDYLALEDAGHISHQHAHDVQGARDAINLPELRVGCGSCCIAGGALDVRTALEQAVARGGIDAVVKPVGCVGMCHQTPMVEITKNGKPVRLYAKVTAVEAKGIVRRHFRPRGIFRRLRSTCSTALDNLLSDDARQPVTRHALDTRDIQVCDFLGPQHRIATESCGQLDPLDIDEYFRHEGFQAAKMCHSDLTAGQIVSAVKQSGLRGRGGAGFPTGEKWARARAAKGDTKYLICNGDEGDPGAFMDRMILESFPYRVLEGMIIAAQAIGATEGILYIREEYPLAVRRIRHAIDVCIQRGLLAASPGLNTQDSKLSAPLHLRVVEGAGAFICGEETALIASVEGKRGMPRLRPPFPVDCGLFGQPTCINNVETYALVPWIVRHGPEAFAAIGTEKSKGTKVFALTGKVVRGGLIEVPMGVTIRQIVEEIGGGCGPGRTFKAVQIGGPSGGCIPAAMADLPVDYESLTAAGAIMGSGGLVVLDDRDCMVDIARYFLAFTQAESCGKCTFCRIGTKVMLDIFTRLCDGAARPGDLEKLEELCGQVKSGSLCGLGQTAPNPVLTTLKYFREEYEAHLKGRCPAGRCKPLIKYVVGDRCIGCTICAQECPSGAIPMTAYQKHYIDPEKCTRCDICRTACPEQCITIVS